MSQLKRQRRAAIQDECAGNGDEFAPEPSLRGGQNVEARDEMGGQCRLVIPTRRLSRLSQIRNSNSKRAGAATCVPPGLLSFEIDARSFDTHLSVDFSRYRFLEKRTHGTVFG